MARYANILETIGNTPLVKLNKLAPPHVEIYVKAEAFNPLGSIKDRLALGIIEAAEKDGSLRPGQTVVEATSGNTGIGLAMVCAQKGYPLVVTMAENFSVERRKLIRFLGARVVLTPAADKASGMLNKARELAEEHGWFLCRQFENEANAEIHSRTTAREILDDFEGDRLDYWVSGFGTGGTMKGVATALKAERPGVRVVAVEPENSVLLASGIAQPTSADGRPTASHPNFRPHLMQGWSPDFISRLASDVLRDGLVDSFVPVGGDESLTLARALAREEGIFCGISGGATLAGALRTAGSAPEGSVIVCMLPDTGERYLTTNLFDDVSVDMTVAEQEISRSTPNHRFDVRPESTPAAAAVVGKEPTPEARAMVEKIVDDCGEPVVMFALEWCEFCWSVRKLFSELGIKYRSVDLDTVKYQENDLGGDLRAALRERTKAPTIPQIFVSGEHIGGCTEIFDAYNDGALQDRLVQSGVYFDHSKKLDAYELLPAWLVPRG